MAPTRLFPYHRNTDYLVIGTSSGGLASLDDFLSLVFCEAEDWWNKEKCKKHLTELEKMKIKDL